MKCNKFISTLLGNDHIVRRYQKEIEYVEQSVDVKGKDGSQDIGKQSLPDTDWDLALS